MFVLKFFSRVLSKISDMIFSIVFNLHFDYKIHEIRYLYLFILNSNVH